MVKPNWKFIANLGDANPAEEGGVFVYEDQTGVYAPEAEILEPCGNGKWRIYRVPLAKCTFNNGVLSDNPFHPDKPAWFADKVDSVRDCCDNPDIEAALCGDDILARSSAYQSLWEYHSLDDFDSYPLRFDPLGDRYTQNELGRDDRSHHARAYE